MAKVDIPSKPDLDLRGKKLLGVANGGDNDAVNKLYVDNAVSNAGGGADELIINGGQVRIADGGVAFTTGIELVTGGSANNDKLITQGYVDNLNTNNVKLTGQSSQTISGSIDINGSIDVVQEIDGSTRQILRASLDSGNLTLSGVDDGDGNISGGNISLRSGATVDNVDVSTLPGEIAKKQDTLPTLNEGRVWTVDSDGDIVQEVIDIVGIADANSPDGTPAGEEIQNLVINTASAGNDALGRWPTTEAWQKANLALKSEGINLTNLPTVGGSVEALPPGPVVYDQANNRYFVESNADFGVWSPYDAYQVNDRVYFDNILFQCVIGVDASAGGLNLSPSSDIFVKSQRPGAAAIPNVPSELAALEPSWVLRRGLIQEFSEGSEYLKDSIVLFDHFGNKQQYKALYSIQSADSTGVANSPERRAYRLPGDSNDDNVWYEHYVGGENGVGDAQVFEFPSIYPGDLMTPAETTGWFIPVGSRWRHNGSIWRFEGPTKTSFPDETLYNITRDAFTSGVSAIDDPETGSGAQHFPPNLFSSFWSEEHEDLSWSPYAIYRQNHSVALYTPEPRTGESDYEPAKLYLRTGADTTYSSALDQDAIDLLTPDVNAGWTEVSGGGGSGGVDVEATFPTDAALGHQILLDPAGNNVTVIDSNGHRRPRGFYSYIQPLSNPNSRYWEQVTIPEVPELYNNAREGDLIYLTDAEDDFNTIGNNFTAGFYRAGPTSSNAQTWISTDGSTGDTASVRVNTTTVDNPNFEADTATSPTGFEYSPPFQNNSGKVSVQVDTREIANALGINSLKEQVHQIEEELSQPGGYTWVDESIFISVFVTNRVNSSGTTDQATILQPHFTDNSNIFTTYALLTGDDDTGLRNQWNGFNSNAAGIIVGLGPDDTDLVAFQLLSTYYRDSTAAGLAEIRLKMIDPDGAFAGPSRVGTNTNKQQFISWISDNDNPITTADPNPVIHQGISTYYYETDNDFLDTVRHDVGSHITGSALTADERVIVDSLVADPNIVKSVSQGDEGALTFSIENHSTGVVSTLMTAGDPILRSQHSTTGNGGWTGTGAPPFSLTINNGGPLGPVGSFYIQDVNPANALAYVRVAANGDVDDFTQITWDLAEEPLTGLQFQGGVLSPTAGTITINSLAGLNGAPTGLSLANVTSFEGAGVEFTGIASMNGAPINALEKLGYFLGVPGAEANGTVSIGGEDTQVTYTPYTTTQAEAGVAEPYVRYFYPTIRIDNLITGALTTVAGNGLGVWSNKILTTTNTDGNGYINLIG